jgi:hypothetical protein
LVIAFLAAMNWTWKTKCETTNLTCLTSFWTFLDFGQLFSNNFWPYFAKYFQIIQNVLGDGNASDSSLESLTVLASFMGESRSDWFCKKLDFSVGGQLKDQSRLIPESGSSDQDFSLSEAHFLRLQSIFMKPHEDVRILLSIDAVSHQWRGRRIPWSYSAVPCPFPATPSFGQ